jgi:hypothetical protein
MNRLLDGTKKFEPKHGSNKKVFLRVAIRVGGVEPRFLVSENLAESGYSKGTLPFPMNHTRVVYPEPTPCASEKF